MKSAAITQLQQAVQEDQNQLHKYMVTLKRRYAKTCYLQHQKDLNRFLDCMEELHEKVKDRQETLGSQILHMNFQFDDCCHKTKDVEDCIGIAKQNLQGDINSFYDYMKSNGL